MLPDMTIQRVTRPVTVLQPTYDDVGDLVEYRRFRVMAWRNDRSPSVERFNTVATDENWESIYRLPYSKMDMGEIAIDCILAEGWHFEDDDIVSPEMMREELQGKLLNVTGFEHPFYGGRDSFITFRVR